MLKCKRMLSVRQIYVRLSAVWCEVVKFIQYCTDIQSVHWRESVRFMQYKSMRCNKKQSSMPKNYEISIIMIFYAPWKGVIDASPNRFVLLVYWFFTNFTSSQQCALEISGFLFSPIWFLALTILFNDR